MINTGIVSVTFRKLGPREIIDLTIKAGLGGIEWGGDIHVPHGDIKRAKEVCKMTKEAGLRIASYGSYYHVGSEEELLFEQVVDSAIALESPMIRVWAGNKGSLEADESWWEKVVNDTIRISEMARAVNKTISFEYHKHSLTDTCESAVKLIEMVKDENVKLYWQPDVEKNSNENKEALENILDWISNIHVFYWDKEGRQPLMNGESEWLEYLDVIKRSGRDHYCLLEFVKGDSSEQFLDDAKTMKDFLAK